MKSKLFNVLPILLCFVFWGCTKNDGLLEIDQLKIEKIISEEFAFEYKYNVDGNLFFITQEFRQSGPNPFFLNVYVQSISPDSLEIGRLRDGLVKDAPTVAIKYDGNKIKEVKRFFGTGEVRMLRNSKSFLRRIFSGCE